ncbi:MAG: hypothetical protein RL226_2185 [Bacteroidota bacterium]
MKKILVIQTAFIGDVVLATSVLESLHVEFPDVQLDILVRKGNESLFNGHPFVRNVLVWNKQEGKYRALAKSIRAVRAMKYDVVVNLHRFASSGLITALSGAKSKRGFKKNPLSFLFDVAADHSLGERGQEKFLHEVDRNHQLIFDLVTTDRYLPKLYPPQVQLPEKPYIIIAPASVWFTKQYPAERWIELVNALSGYKIFIAGARSDASLANTIIEGSHHTDIENKCGAWSMLESAAFMKGAAMTYCNDSAPMHFCSAVDAPVTAVFCSTIPEFGFGPLGPKAHIVQVNENLACRPCGLHGKRSCPEKHFNCANNIALTDLLNVLRNE